MDRTPLMLVGDGPQEPSGLGRILRDLAMQIHTSDLPVELVTVGGSVPPVWRAWPHYPLDERLHRGDDWGASYIEALWRSHFGERPGVVWLIWDPSRVAYYQQLSIPVRVWAYTAIDAPNATGKLSGAPALGLGRIDRVLAYGRWASTILASVRRPAPYLPHGLVAGAGSPATDEERTWARQTLGAHLKRDSVIIGAVATNQPRKDLGLFCQALNQLQARGVPVYGWLHTDVLVKAWSVAQLVEDCGLEKAITVTLDEYDDRQLAALYQQCAVTIAPGLGEGFGYPIVESLANGVPVVHGDWAGGRELVPKREWRVPVRETRLDGVYALQRPVFRAEDVVNAVERARDWQQRVGAETAAAYCRGSVAHLDWAALWGRWHGWIKAGL